MSSISLATFLNRHGLQRHLNEFDENDVDFETLLELEADDFDLLVESLELPDDSVARLREALRAWRGGGDGPAAAGGGTAGDAFTPEMLSDSNGSFDRMWGYPANVWVQKGLPLPIHGPPPSHLPISATFSGGLPAGERRAQVKRMWPTLKSHSELVLSGGASAAEVKELEIMLWRLDHLVCPLDDPASGTDRARLEACHMGFFQLVSRLIGCSEPFLAQRTLVVLQRLCLVPAGAATIRRLGLHRDLARQLTSERPRQAEMAIMTFINMSRLDVTVTRDSGALEHLVALVKPGDPGLLHAVLLALKLCSRTDHDALAGFGLMKRLKPLLRPTPSQMTRDACQIASNLCLSAPAPAELYADGGIAQVVALLSGRDKYPNYGAQMVGALAGSGHASELASAGVVAKLASMIGEATSHASSAATMALSSLGPAAAEGLVAAGAVARLLRALRSCDGRSFPDQRHLQPGLLAQCLVHVARAHPEAMADPVVASTLIHLLRSPHAASQVAAVTVVGAVVGDSRAAARRFLPVLPLMAQWAAQAVQREPAMAACALIAMSWPKEVSKYPGLLKAFVLLLPHPQNGPGYATALTSVARVDLEAVIRARALPQLALGVRSAQEPQVVCNCLQALVEVARVRPEAVRGLRVAEQVVERHLVSASDHVLLAAVALMGATGRSAAGQWERVGGREALASLERRRPALAREVDLARRQLGWS